MIHSEQKNTNDIWRMLGPALFLLALDQGTKGLAQLFLRGRTIMFFGRWGLTYVTNPGIWVNPDLPPGWFHVIRLCALIIWALAVFARRYYIRYYRSSRLADWAFAGFTLAVFGNVFVDRLVFGFIRDFWITPVAICNLADIGLEIGACFGVLELVLFAPSRRLLRVLRPADEIMRWKRFLSFAVKEIRGISARPGGSGFEGRI